MCAAILFGKVNRVQSHAYLTFGNTVCLQYEHVDNNLLVDDDNSDSDFDDDIFDDIPEDNDTNGKADRRSAFKMVGRLPRVSSMHVSKC